MKYFVFFTVACFCTSCLFSPKFSKDTVSYTRAGEAASFAVVVPRGFNSENTVTDSSGAQIKTYSYAGGAVLYFAQMKDTVTMLRHIDTISHIPEWHAAGGKAYKGVDEDYTFWREVRKGYLRAGYRNVTVPVEARFDSAVNFAVWGAKM